MGLKARAKPRRLPHKLRQIRIKLGLSQSQLIRHLKLKGVAYTRISKFEKGSSEPTLLDLLRYARAAGVCVDVLIDDRQNLPKTLPGIPMHSGMDLPAIKG